MARNSANPIPDELYNMLACPMCKDDLRYTSDKRDFLVPSAGQNIR